MPLDAICLSAVVAELRDIALNAKVDKVTQPEHDSIVLQLRTLSRGNVRLLINVNPNIARLHLTAIAKENPAVAPMFCMLLRKHLSGARLLSMEQLDNERVVTLTFSGFDELGVPVERRLCAELMARSANLYFLDAEQRILAALRPSRADITALRPNLPGMVFRPPVPLDKPAATALTLEDWRALWRSAQGRADRALLDGCCGFSPLLAREAVYRSCGAVDAEVNSGNVEALACGCYAFFSQAEFAPVLLSEDGQPKDFSCVDVQQYQGAWQVKELDSFGALLDSYYGRRDADESMKRKASGLTKLAKNNCERIKRKLIAQQQEWVQSQRREELLKRGELIKSNLHRIEKGADSVTVEDYYSEGCPPLTIALEPLLTPQQNAAKAFKNYTKAKNAEAVLQQQMALGEADLVYWQSVQEAIERCTSERELADIRAEVSPRIEHKKGKKQQPQSKPHLFRSTEGLRIWAGRNNVQNEQLTLHTAGKNDWWLHVQKMAGAHVIIETNGQKPSPQTFSEAATIAVTLSAAKNGVKVPVDTTQVRHVKKLARGKPGMVIYEQFTTIIADADATLLDRLRENC